MPLRPDEIVASHAAHAATYPNGRPLAADAPDAWRASLRPGAGRLGAARVRDSARREWRVEAHRDGRGRWLRLAPVRGDNEPFKASCDGHRPDAFLPVGADDWTLLALLVAGREGDDLGRDDGELRDAAFPLVDRLVREAQHRLLMGAAEDEDDDG